MTPSRVDNLLDELVKDLWALSDELMAKGRSLDPDKHWERSCFFMRAVGVGDATKKVLEAKSKIRNEWYDELDKEKMEAQRKWSERIDLREQEITYNRINGIS